MNNIKQFSLADERIIIGEIISESDDYLELKNIQEILLQFDEENETLHYNFTDYYTDFLFAVDNQHKIYYNNIVIETIPETHVLLHYIGNIKDREKQKRLDEKSREFNHNTTLH